MPELPEVEIVKRELSTKIIGDEILFFETYGKKFKRTIPDLNILKNHEIINIFRRNKYIIMETKQHFVVFHLGMTGQLIFNSELKKINHNHYNIYFKSGIILQYIDPRRFGSLDLFEKSNHKTINDIYLLKNLGIEPLSEEFTFDYFMGFRFLKTNIKKFLMDSKYVCGIGNIYACEILFLSKTSPLKSVIDLSDKQFLDVYNNIKLVLNKAIQLGGSSISDFIHTDGIKGEMQNFYKVYGRLGSNCNICFSDIEKVNQYGRSTYFCKKCQD